MTRTSSSTPIWLPRLPTRIDLLALIASAGTWLGCGLGKTSDSGANQDWLNEPVSIVCPPGNGNVVLLDRTGASLVKVDTTTGKLSLLSARDFTGAGPELRKPLLMTQGSSDDTVLVLAKDESERDVVLEISLDSGARRTLKNLEPNSALALTNTANDLALTPDDSHLIVADGHAGLISIDLDSGERDQGGEIPGVAKGLAVSEEGTLWVALVGTASFVELDLDSNDTRQELPPGPGSPRDLVLSDENHAIALFGGGPAGDTGLSDGLRRVDLSTGEQEQISGGEAGDGPAFGLPTSFCVADDQRNAFVLDSQESALFRVDLDSGERSILVHW